MKDIITIGLPSKGRLKEKSISFFNDKGLKIIQSGKERNYFGYIENKPNVKIIFLHAKEIIQRLGDGTIDIGVSGLDLLQESEKNLQGKINIQKKLDYGNANLVIAVPMNGLIKDIRFPQGLSNITMHTIMVINKYPYS